MAKHLKTRIMNGMSKYIASFCAHPSKATPYSKEVRYFHTSELYTELHGVMNTRKAGRKAKKHIIVRPSRHHLGLHELYTYHFPTHWSAACVANRELIKLAQRQAHTIERDHSRAALEWWIRFLHQYYSLPAWNKSMTDVPVEKRRYPHFYSYVFTTIYYALKSAQAQANDQIADVSFEPIYTSNYHRPYKIRRTTLVSGSSMTLSNSVLRQFVNETS